MKEKLQTEVKRNVKEEEEEEEEEKTYTSASLGTLPPQIVRDGDAEVGLVGGRGAGVELALVGVAAGPRQQRLPEDGVGGRLDDAHVGAPHVRDRQVHLDGDDLAGRVDLHVRRVVGELLALAEPHCRCRHHI